MLTYTGLRNLFGSLTNNSSTTNLSLGDTLINQADAKVVKAMNWDFLEKDVTLSSRSSQQFYTLPNDLEAVKSVTVTISSIIYCPKASPSRDHWNYLNQSNTTTSDIPEWYYVTEGKVGFYPIPSTNHIDNITVMYGRKRKNLSIADYTTGTITTCPYTTTFTAVFVGTESTGNLSGAWALPTGIYTLTFSSGEKRTATLTNGSTAVTLSAALTLAATATVTFSSANDGSIVVGSSTVWTVKMNSRWMVITDSNTAAAGDGVAYEIDEVLSNTCLTLVKTYGGAAIASGTAAYTLGQCSLIPEEYQDLPVFKACEVYFTTIQPEPPRAAMFRTMYLEGLQSMATDFSDKVVELVTEFILAHVSSVEL